MNVDTLEQRAEGTAATGGARSGDVWIAGALLMVHAVLAWLGRIPGVASGHDDAWYFLLSRQLLRLSYDDAFMVGSPLHNLYPPGYPALLALWSPFGGLHLDWLVLLNVLFSTGALALTFDGVRRTFGAPTALLALAVLAVNPDLLARAGTIAAEPAFTFFVVLTLWMVLRDPHGSAWPVALAALAATLVRTVGVALFAGLLVHWVLQRRWQAVGLLTAAGVVVGAWILLTVMAPYKTVGRSYIADMGVRRGTETRGPLLLVLRRMLTGLYFYSAMAFPWVLRMPTVAGTVIDNMVVLGVNLMGLGAGLVLMLRRWRLAALYALATGGLLVMWVWRLDRFLIPLLPVLVPALIAGIAWWVGRLRRSWAMPAVSVFCAALVVSAFVVDVNEIAARADCERVPEGWPESRCQTERERSFFEAVAWAKDNLPDDAVVYVSKVATFHLYTGLMTVPTGAVANLPVERRLEHLRGLGVDYMLVSRTNIADLNTFLPLAEAECARLEVEAAWQEALLLRLPATAGGGGACAEVARLRAVLEAAAADAR